MSMQGNGNPRQASATREPAGTRSLLALDAVDAIDPHADHDHEEEEGDNQESWLRRLGVPLGSGGTKICKPARPPVVIHKAAVTP